MAIVSESYTLDLSDPSFVRLSYSARMQTMAGLSDQHKTIWFERQNARWLADAITRCMTRAYATKLAGELARL